MGLALVWVFAWIPIFLAVSALDGGLSGERTSPLALVFLAVWFGVIVLPAAAYGFAMFAASMWRHRPRRVWEPVREDLRDER